ncbi:MAG: non-heme iron oxygenase ferredoxin subunit [Chloroflexi bacterium]|nr:MAG: non-heme iron oxygenase ferredoxin subunit [Chloroflexota bacterium]
MSTPVCLISELPVGATKQLIVDGKQVGLFNIRGTVYAIGNICTHAYAELHDGYVDDDDCTVDCPLHGARFDLKTGAHLTLPAVADVARYQVTVDATHIFVAPYEVQA